MGPIQSTFDRPRFRRAFIKPLVARSPLSYRVTPASLPNTFVLTSSMPKESQSVWHLNRNRSKKNQATSTPRLSSSTVSRRSRPATTDKNNSERPPKKRSSTTRTSRCPLHDPTHCRMIRSALQHCRKVRGPCSDTRITRYSSATISWSCRNLHHTNRTHSTTLVIHVDKPLRLKGTRRSGHSATGMEYPIHLCRISEARSDFQIQAATR